MVADSAPLSGSGPQLVWIEHRRVGQDQAGNFTQFYVEVRYYGNGYGSWTGGTLYWSADAPGFHVEGAFTIPQANRYDTYTVLYAGYYNRSHDSAGNLGSFNAQASINGNVHASIGSGTVVVTEPASPRIAKRPSAPPFSIDRVESDSFRVVVSAPADNGGSPIERYLIRVSTNPRADTPGTYVNYYGSGTQTIGGQTPGTKRYVTVYAQNGSADNNGYSTYQASKAVELEAGVYVSNGSKWVPAGPRVSSGTAWSNIIPTINDGDSYEQPIDLFSPPTFVDVDNDTATSVRLFVSDVDSGATHLEIQRASSAAFTDAVITTQAVRGDGIYTLSGIPAGTWWLRVMWRAGDRTGFYSEDVFRITL